ncbi:MAG: DegT/DnrJ/EryC1/StrS family aminotransferase [Chloroflexota bacterium]|nr:MAG: DegT/DnrJ/EryC1/StrS family aminotransferase [Chloroflexota bacterium]
MAGPGFELIGAEEIAEVLDVLRGGWVYRYGAEDNPNFKAKVWSFEKAMAEYVGVKHAVAVNSGSTALWIALLALGIGPGDQVIVPGFTFIASISAIVYAQAVPVLAEIDRTFNLDPADVERKITPRTKAIMAVHLMGNPARMEELKTIAERHGLLLLEDCAQAFGASYKGRAVGSIGHIGAFSFNYAKVITAGEGGLITTDDDALYQRCFALHDQGHAPLRKGREVGARPFLGLDFRMTELQGAVLLAQFRKLAEIRARLYAHKQIFRSIIKGLPGLEFRELTDAEGEAATVLTVIFPNAEIAQGVARELNGKLLVESGWHVYSNMEPLLEKRVPVERGYPFHHPDAEFEAIEYAKGMLPQTDELVARAFNIGIGMTDKALATYGVTVRSTGQEVEACAKEFRRVAAKYLQ